MARLILVLAAILSASCTASRERLAKDHFDLARRLYVSGRYIPCIEELERLHKFKSEYGNSREIEQFCREGLELSLRQQINEVLARRVASESDAGVNEIWRLKQINLDSPDGAGETKKTVAEDTRADHPMFSVTIPKGWSAIHKKRGAAEETLLIAPAVSSESCRFGVISRLYTAKTIAEIIRSLTVDSHKIPEMEVMNGLPWIKWKLNTPGAPPATAMVTSRDSTIWNILIIANGSESAGDRRLIERVITSLKIN